MKFAQSPDLRRQNSDCFNHQGNDWSALKPTVLLTAAIFLTIAPAPNAQDIAEITANFISSSNEQNTGSRKTRD